MAEIPRVLRRHPGIFYKILEHPAGRGAGLNFPDLPLLGGLGATDPCVCSSSVPLAIATEQCTCHLVRCTCILDEVRALIVSTNRTQGTSA